MTTRLMLLTLLIAMNLPALAQDELAGRLFTTASERARLDQMQKLDPLHLGTVAPAGAPVAQADAQPEQLTLNGYVTRSSGKNTTWINGIAHDESDYNGRVHVSQRPGHKAEISMKTAGGKRIDLKVGDTFDLQTGTLHRIDEPTEAAPTAAKLH